MQLDLGKVQERIVANLRDAEGAAQRARDRTMKIRGQLEEAEQAEAEARERLAALRGALDLTTQIAQEIEAAAAGQGQAPAPAGRPTRGRPRKGAQAAQEGA